MYVDELQKNFESVGCTNIKDLLDNHLQDLEDEGMTEYEVNCYYYLCVLKKGDYSTLDDITKYVTDNLANFTVDSACGDLIVYLIDLNDRKKITLDSTFLSTIQDKVKDSFAYAHYKIRKLLEELSDNIIAGKTFDTDAMKADIETYFVDKIYMFILKFNKDKLQSMVNNVKLFYDFYENANYPDKLTYFAKLGYFTI
jgi:hypothetical protein